MRVYDLSELLLWVSVYIRKCPRGASHFGSAASLDVRGVSCALVAFYNFSSRRTVAACEERKPNMRREVAVHQFLWGEIERVCETGVSGHPSVEASNVSQEDDWEEQRAEESLCEDLCRGRE